MNTNLCLLYDNIRAVIILFRFNVESNRSQIIVIIKCILVIHWWTGRHIDVIVRSYTVKRRTTLGRITRSNEWLVWLVCVFVHDKNVVTAVRWPWILSVAIVIYFLYIRQYIIASVLNNLISESSSRIISSVHWPTVSMRQIGWLSAKHCFTGLWLHILSTMVMRTWY